MLPTRAVTKKTGASASTAIPLFDDSVFSFTFFFLETNSKANRVAAIEKTEFKTTLLAIAGKTNEGMKAAADITHIIAMLRSERQFLSVNPEDAKPFFVKVIAPTDKAIIRI